jgi:hypothetical protein
LLPVSKAAPPVEAAYQSIFAPALAVAERLVVPVAQMSDPSTEDATVGLELIVKFKVCTESQLETLVKVFVYVPDVVYVEPLQV